MRYVQAGWLNMRSVMAALFNLLGIQLSLTLTKKPRQYGVEFVVGQVIPEIDGLRLSQISLRRRIKSSPPYSGLPDENFDRLCPCYLRNCLST